MKTNILPMNKFYMMILSFFKKNRLKKKADPPVRQKSLVIKPTNQEIELTIQVEDFLKNNYFFRYNEITEQTEYMSRKENSGEYLPVQQRELNSYCMEARQSGVNCWDRDISRYVYSKSIPAYHPFTHYMNHLPAWDGKDRVTSLAERISTHNNWVTGFHTWMLGLTSQWIQLSSSHANSVAPVLISCRQGLNKSTFCRMLVPGVLQPYYTDSFEIGGTNGAEQKLTSFGLINLDELDKFSERKMALLKNLMQMTSLNIRKAYKKSFSPLPRIASFIATSNRKDLLTDPTGSRRFLCVEIENKIDCSPINHAQLYAQLKAELSGGKRSWFDSKEESVMMENNEDFQKRNIAEDLFYSCFRLPESGEQGQYLSAIQIYSELKDNTHFFARLVSPGNFGKVLIMLGAERKHTKYGNLYHVIMRNRSQGIKNYG